VRRAGAGDFVRHDYKAADQREDECGDLERLQPSWPHHS
jgi:hypothetical protein